MGYATARRIRVKRKRAATLISTVQQLEQDKVPYRVLSYRGGARICVTLQRVGRQVIMSFIHPTKKVTKGRVSFVMGAL